MGNFLSAVLAWLLGAFARIFAAVSAYGMFSKIILATLFITILPIIINNAFHDIMQVVFNAASTYASGLNPTIETAVSFTGLAGYLLDACGLIDAMAVTLSAVAIRFALSWIPFVGPR